MIMDKKKIRFGVTDLLLFAVSALYAAGLKLWFPVCETGETLMACHWAGRALFAASLLFAGTALLHLFVPDGKMKAGMDIPLAGLSVLIMLIPGRVIAVCGMPGMACRSGTQPWSIGFGAALFVLSLADLFFYLSREFTGRHARKG